ncbi:uncharacterized protein LOC113296093 [Papaver somniferum]|uniref:uncharacterized protein LOC113296093 n=1 Tax=Papaver somniferum TaxID=3469 RepID=UPI000E6FCD42|nr:uncharacterized protein LOC113296093 [Papaver somniferum]
MSSPSQTLALVVTEEREAVDTQLSSLVYDVSQQVQVAMESMLKMTNEIDQSSSGIMEEIEKCKDSATEKKMLDEEKERFQKAAYMALDMLNNTVSYISHHFYYPLLRRITFYCSEVFHNK